MAFVQPRHFHQIGSEEAVAAREWMDSGWNDNALSIYRGFGHVKI